MDFIQLFLAMSELKPGIWLKWKSWILPARKLQLFRIIFVSVGHAATMPDRNNYANNDVEILYRLYLMYLMYEPTWKSHFYENVPLIVNKLQWQKIWFGTFLSGLMYVHNYSVQSVDSSERMIVMLCAYLNSFPYRIYIFLLFICLIRVQRYKNSAKSFCVAAKKWYKHAYFKQKEQSW